MNTGHCRCLTTLFLMLCCAMSTAAGGDSSIAGLRPGTGKLVSVSLAPDQVLIRGQSQVQQLIVTGHYENGLLRDLTGEATWEFADPKIARVEGAGLLLPISDGETTLTVRSAAEIARTSVTVRGMSQDDPIHFANQIVPILTKIGCNAGACHGKKEGQNGFKLSLLGFDPAADYTAIVHEGRGRRVYPPIPERSLVLMKPTGGLGHGGGELLEVDSPDYRLLLRWIESGLPYGKPTDPRVVRISVTPADQVLALAASQQVSVRAHFDDGSSTDVTLHAQYQSNDDDLLSVSDAGRIRSHERHGAGSVMIRYLGHVAVFRARIPTDLAPDRFPELQPNSFVDEKVFGALRDLGIPPSNLCSDGEFLRRVSIDITGTLPTPAEVTSFLANANPEKRTKLIDDLLARPEYGYCFTLKWGDILRNRTVGNGKKEPGPNAQSAAFQQWIYASLMSNKPYDRFVREIITATGVPTGSETAQPAVAWYRQLTTPEMLADDTAQAFLGTRIQCAQCHNHPFEKWRQDDYWGMAAFFARVRAQADGGKKGEGKSAADIIEVKAEGQVRNPQGKLYSEPKPLDGEILRVSPGDDPRVQLVDWMVRTDNPLFARALVNRYWGHFFGRGIVDPIDDMRVTNPPANQALLDSLAADFVAHGFDMKHLIRTICTSKAYQLSSEPNQYNAEDQSSFARAMVRRLPAEVLLDAVDQVTGSLSEFRIGGDDSRVGERLPSGTRAIQLADTATASTFLTMFGKPDRGSACECDRSNEVTLAQRLHLLNSELIGRKLKSSSGRAARWAADQRTDSEKIEEAFLAAFARRPTTEELRIVKQHVATNPESAYADLLWSLINTKEFQFNH